MPVAAFAGAVLALSATLVIAGRSLSPSRTILAGVAVSSLFAALTSLLIFWTATGDSFREIINWLLGSLAGARWPAVAISLGAILVVGVPMMMAGRALDAFAFGDTSAASLGVDVARTRWVMLTATALLTGAMVAVSGAIGFVGLVLPHAVRLVVGVGHRALLPLSALTGAIFLIWCDTLARSLFDPREGKPGVVVTFLSILELAKEQLVDIVQEAALAPIYLKSLAIREDGDTVVPALTSEFDDDSVEPAATPLAANDDA